MFPPSKKYSDYVAGLVLFVSEERAIICIMYLFVGRSRERAFDIRLLIGLIKQPAAREFVDDDDGPCDSP